MDQTLVLMLTAVFAPVVAGLATLLLPERWHAARTLVSFAGMAGAFAALLPIVRAGEAGVIGFEWVPSLNLHMTFRADALGGFFGLLVSGIGALIVLYARGYFGPDGPSLRRFFPTLGFFATAMMGLVLCDNMLGMLVFWELTSVSSFLLIGWHREDPKSVRLAIQALVTTGTGGLALMGGLLALGVNTGAWSFSEFGELMASGGLTEPARAALPWIFLLILLGGFAKSAQWPLHFWLPGAMAAPTPVSAYLHSATMVKAGVYLFARLYPAMRELEWWGPALAGFGAVTMLLGAFLALRSHELKRLFAYTTVSQLGLLVCAYGLGATDHHGEANLIWPVTQILNHALYKAPLFIIAGAIMHVAHRKRLPELKGLLRERPALALTCIGAAYALAGGPFTLSFTAKEAFLYQATHAAEHVPLAWAVVAMAVLTATINVAIFVRILTTFAGRAPETETEHANGHEHAHEGGFWGACVWWPAAAIVLWQFVGGIAPGFFESLVRPVETHPLYWDHLPGVIHAVTHPSLPLALSGVAFALGIALGLAPLLRTVFSDPHDRLFPAIDRRGELIGYRALRVVQTGNFRWYAYATFSALLVALIGVALRTPELRSMPRVASMAGADVGLIAAAIIAAVLICSTALALPMLRSRINRVLMLGAGGFAVTMMYLLYQAPDLALTQLMFELISVVLFLLVLRMLPEEPKARPRGGRLGRAVFAGFAGLVIGALVLHAASVPDFDGGRRLGDWFLAHSYEGPGGARGGGGDNVVNVVLVDFRGYDTLGEITVLGITAIAILSLIGSAPARKLRAMLEHDAMEDHAGRFRADDPHGVDIGPQPTLTSSLFSVALRLLLPLALIFAAYMFFKGHNEPGGGFIAGLTAAVALAVYRMAEGPAALKRLLPIKPAPMAALGLGVALLSAVIPMALGEPFLRSFHDVASLPGGGSYHWASVMLFDLGVLIVVVGVSVGIINRLTEELE